MSDQDATDVERRSEGRVRDPEHILGKAIAQRYVVKKCVGQGGMGVVYTAIQQALDREVVLKVVRTDAADPDAQDRFQREARSLSRLSHPNIVQIYDHGKDEPTDLSFIAMEYVRGITLSRFCKKRGGYLPVSEFRPIAQQMLEGVAEAHRVGLIHRDLKPSNVMLTSPDGETLRVKILDFGLSKLARGGEPLTRVNQMLGSAMYMAPEQFKGGTIDARADVYALGVIFYQMLSGRRPVLGDDNYQVLMQQVGGQVTPLADALPSDNPVPATLIALIDRCLSVDPAARPHDARALQGALEIALASTQGQSAITARLIATSPDSATGTESSTLRSNESPTQSGSNLSESHARVGMYAGLLTGGLSLLVLVLVLVLLVFLALEDTLFGSEEPAPPVAEVQQVDQGVMAANALRERALEAIREAQYDRAVTLLTEAVTMAPAQGDLKELLTIAVDLKEKAKAAPPPEPVVEPEPEPEPVARRSSPRPSPRPRPRPAPQPPPVGTAVITTIPKGIRFEIEGVGDGVTPANLADVPAGTHAITFFWEGMPIHSDQLEVGRGAVQLFDQDLGPMIPKPEPEPEPEPAPAPEPEPDIAVAAAPPPPEPEAPVAPEVEAPPAATTGELLIESPNVYGDIWIDGRNFGKPPIVAKDLPLGTVKVEVRVGSKTRREATATVEPDRREKLTIR